MEKMNKEEKIQYANFLIEEITSKFLQKGSPYVIMEGYEYLREVITLYAKQSNLFESILILFENSHAEEAYILVRSMLNNAMLIDYLCNDNKNKLRYKNYMVQPLKSELAFLYDIERAIERGWVKNEYEGLKEKIKERENILRQEGFVHKGEIDTRLLSIKGMALSDKLLFAYYMAFYREASKYEHSDFSSLDIYRTPIDSDIPNTHAFILDLSRTDTELEEKVLNLSISIYSLTFIKLLQYFTKNHEHLIPEENKPYLAQLAIIIWNKTRENNFPFYTKFTEQEGETDG